MTSQTSIHLDIPPEATPVSAFCTPSTQPKLYPGTRPVWSFCFLGEQILPIAYRENELMVMITRGRWESLNEFVVDKTGCDLTSRFAVLAVGSNACPARLADSNKYGGQSSLAIPALRGWINDVVSVYVPRLASYGSVPATVMAMPGASTELWVTLLTESELRLMDESEGRGVRYDLVEMPTAEFGVEGGLSIASISAYYEPLGLRDVRTGKPILLSCFEATGADLPSLSQEAVQNYIDDITPSSNSLATRNEVLTNERSVPIPFPSTAQKLDGTSLPSRKVQIVPHS